MSFNQEELPEYRLKHSCKIIIDRTVTELELDKLKILPSIEAQIRRTLDQFYARWPQSIPSKDRLAQCKLISHRGEYDNQNIFENTVASFDRARDGGVWGIELDLRWTKDLHPVVLHDTNLQRVFGSDTAIHQTTLAELQSECALVPTLAEIIARYGKKMHLMIEIKSEVYPDPTHQNRILAELFAALQPVEDYHFLSLTPQMFNVIECAPRNAFLPVAHFNFFRLSKLALRQNYSGVAGHYVLLTRLRLKRHQAHKQNLATGYVNSRNCLFRELNRGVQWIFSDNAVELQKVVNQLLQTGRVQAS